jgi:hypothetical protein
VVEFLSDDWVAALDAGARAADIRHHEAFVVETVVPTAHGARGYQVRLGPAGASVVAPGSGPADVELVTDPGTAWALHEGTVRAQDAFARGALKVRGRPEALAGRGEVLAALERAFAPVRAETTPIDDR